MNDRLIAFVQKFLNNFVKCDACDGTGEIPDFKIECERCKGTGKRIASIGVLYVELPDEARQLLKDLRQP